MSTGAQSVPRTDARPAARVLVTREAHKAGALADALRALGLAPVVLPAIAHGPPEAPGALDRALTDTGAYDWLALTSPTAVDAVLPRLDPPARADLPPIAVVGPGTADRLRAHGVEPALVPSTHTRAALIDAIVARGPARVLVPRSAIAPPWPPTPALQVREVVAYRTVPAEPPPDVDPLLSDLAALTWASPSAAESLAQTLGTARWHALTQLPSASIGPRTTDACRRLSLDVQAEADPHTIEGLAQAARAIVPQQRQRTPDDR